MAAGLAQTPATAPVRDIKVARKGQKRALVVGNSAYPKWPLKNASNDASDMAIALREVGFDTEVVLNAPLKTLEQAVDRFVAKLGPNDTALFFFAGHGIQLANENYLVPIDFDAKDEADAKYVAYSASRIHDRMDASGATLNIVILDACRNNPFGSGRSFGGGGLAAMNSGKGSFIAFATAPGKTASDNPQGRNGLFTASLLATLRQQGLSLDQVFNRVRQQVYESSRQQQLPWTSSSVIGDFFFRGSGPVAAVAVPPPVEPEPAPSAPVNPLARRNSQPEPEPLPTEQTHAQPFFSPPTETAPPVMDAGVLASQALAAFQQGDSALFEARARAALAAGGRLALPVAHYHTIAGVHPSLLLIEPGRIGFDPMGHQCSQKPVSGPAGDIVSAEFAFNKFQEPLLNVKFRDPQNPKKTLNFNFGTPDSSMVQSGSLPVMRSGAHAPLTLQALARILQEHAGKISTIRASLPAAAAGASR
ncbi:MAG: caspase family protein [Bryobacteraceae bacterium]|nr:caspase family protein [Bryobacteraceae bacterium]